MTFHEADRSGKPPAATSGAQRARRLGEYLVATLGGNILFLILEPHLPAVLRHQAFRVDWGLGVDFAICAALYGVIRFSRHR
jgi:hypothetical protein